MKKTAFIILIIFFFSTEIIEAQCAMCRAVLESGEQQTAAKGINNGIIYLMAIPYILVGGLGYFIFRSYKKKTS
ncbi:hypothetical protein GTQ40_14000 [Flavobacteriaceae bacterium R38]|nr:hypothetical protein [Flavobacteriaceae bacterium R38]